MEEPIVNRVSQSKLVEIDPADFRFAGETLEIDLAGLLFQGLILREKDLRDFIKEHNWEQYAGKRVAVFCSADAILPAWAFMLVASALSGRSEGVYFGNKAETERAYMEQRINEIDLVPFRDKKIVIKGCGDFQISAGIYLKLVERLQPVASGIMYGEPCSTVPVYKKK